LHRRKIDRLEILHQAFRKYALRGVHEFNVGVGRYVIMPDHIHFFVRGDAHFDLIKWLNGLKRAMSVAVGTVNRSLWQPGFFDHVLRNEEAMRRNGSMFSKILFVLDWSIQLSSGHTKGGL
jgi:REP element-mobilizing transposase RayT